MRPVLVTGGTGTHGRAVVARLLDGGHEVRVASRRPGAARVVVDLRSEAGVDRAVAGVDAIVHCATTGGAADVHVTRTLVDGARRAGTPHLVFISIVGVDRLPLGYYRAKLAAERVVGESGLGWTVLRATQFHDLVAWLWRVQRRSPVIVSPASTSIQPIDVRDVAARLVELATGPPAGRVPDLGGPEVRGATDLARTYVRATGRRGVVLPIRFPGAVAAGYRRGHHLTVPRSGITFDQFLAERGATVGRHDPR
jgi:uncharacterized protein YbjT (DUF2867 family)